MPESDMSEENLKNGPKTELRWGFTTGTAATAAAIAAVSLLCGQIGPKTVEVLLPNGRRLTIEVAETVLINQDEALAVVIKDAGDDPDITNKARIGVIVRRRSINGLIKIVGGPGVGRVTKPGLVLPPGEWAINPGPRKMLVENLSPLLKKNVLPGVEVEIFVERGEELASKTLNPRLGIIGGISILGNTGLVKPFSHKAYTDTIDSALNLAKAAGLREAVLTTGRQSEQMAMNRRSELPPEAFVQIADFYKEGLSKAAQKGFETIGLAVFFGKAIKQASGIPYTHAHKNDLEIAELINWFPDLNAETKKLLKVALTARAALDILKNAGALSNVSVVAEKMLISAREFAGSKPRRLWAIIFDYDGQVLSYKEELAE